MFWLVNPFFLRDARASAAGKLSRPVPPGVLHRISTMNRSFRLCSAVTVVTALAASAWLSSSFAADGEKNPVKDFMKAYHKAPKGVEPVCKKASDGKATPEEIHKLVAGYKMMLSAKPAKGDEASWKEKTAKLLSAAEGLEKGGPAAAAKYKEAVNCKACHSVHKPD